jgi:hypothetical protein
VSYGEGPLYQVVFRDDKVTDGGWPSRSALLSQNRVF